MLQPGNVELYKSNIHNRDGVKSYLIILAKVCGPLSKLKIVVDWRVKIFLIKKIKKLGPASPTAKTRTSCSQKKRCFINTTAEVVAPSLII